MRQKYAKKEASDLKGGVGNLCSSPWNIIVQVKDMVDSQMVLSSGER